MAVMITNGVLAPAAVRTGSLLGGELACRQAGQAGAGWCNQTLRSQLRGSGASLC